MSIPKAIQDLIDAQCDAATIPAHGDHARDDWDLSQPDHPNPGYRR